MNQIKYSINELVDPSLLEGRQRNRLGVMTAAEWVAVAEELTEKRIDFHRLGELTETELDKLLTELRIDYKQWVADDGAKDRAALWRGVSEKELERLRAALRREVSEEELSRLRTELCVTELDRTELLQGLWGSFRYRLTVYSPAIDVDAGSGPKRMYYSTREEAYLSVHRLSTRRDLGWRSERVR